eukprot:c18374_g1_i2.p1 GENE.c18374_g1_i2~~c18374_g1_i2.p1  ORF type:complete len:250 (-),score=41.36 c18374_g1_i2:450-1199(-)
MAKRKAQLQQEQPAKIQRVTRSRVKAESADPEQTKPKIETPPASPPPPEPSRFGPPTHPGLIHLCQVDAGLKALYEKHGPPSFLTDPTMNSACGALCHIVVGQQVSSAVARTIWGRVVDLCDGHVDHASLIAVGQSKLRSAGLSGRKVEYVLSIANSFATSALSSELLSSWDGDRVADELIRLKGIGPWSVDMFRMFHLRHIDVFPVGDLGVRKGVARHFGHTSGTLPSNERLVELTDAWKPYRSIGSW